MLLLFNKHGLFDSIKGGRAEQREECRLSSPGDQPRLLQVSLGDRVVCQTCAGIFSASQSWLKAMCCDFGISLWYSPYYHLLETLFYYVNNEYASRLISFLEGCFSFPGTEALST